MVRSVRTGTIRNSIEHPGGGIDLASRLILLRSVVYRRVEHDAVFQHVQDHLRP